MVPPVHNFRYLKPVIFAGPQLEFINVRVDPIAHNSMNPISVISLLAKNNEGKKNQKILSWAAIQSPTRLIRDHSRQCFGSGFIFTDPDPGFFPQSEPGFRIQISDPDPGNKKPNFSMAKTKFWEKFLFSTQKVGILFLFSTNQVGR